MRRDCWTSFCVRGGDRDDGGLGAVTITRSATRAGADRAVCAALPAQSALWGPVDERIAALGCFSNAALMELVGFNARQVEEGLTKRGDAQRQGQAEAGPALPTVPG